MALDGGSSGPGIGLAVVQHQAGSPVSTWIAYSRSFSERITDLESLREAVVSYTSRAIEKLRAQGDYCRLLQVYIRTGLFNPCEVHYGRRSLVSRASTGQATITRSLAWCCRNSPAPTRSRMTCSSRNHDQAAKR